MIEHWVELEEHPRYLISNVGRVYDRFRDRILVQTQDRGGYLRVHIWINYDRKVVSVHRLVAGAFFAADICDYEVNHRDNDKTNNHIANLELTDRSGNMLHAFNNGYAVPVHTPFRVKIVETGEVFDSTGQIDRHLGVASGSVSKTLRGLQQTVKGYTFERIS